MTVRLVVENNLYGEFTSVQRHMCVGSIAERAAAYGIVGESVDGNDVRAVFTIIYMDKDMRLVEPTSNERRFDAEMWCPGVKVGEIIDSPINPVLYSRE